jgi:hypothetical protein
MDEVPPRAADLPQALVGLVPAALEEVHQLADDGPGVVVGCQPMLADLVEAAEDLAVDVELELAGRAVADPHRPGAFVAGKPVEDLL